MMGQARSCCALFCEHVVDEDKLDDDEVVDALAAATDGGWF